MKTRQRLLFVIAIFLTAHAATAQMAERPRVGLALGGGSARGFAHVGVLRWFEEHPSRSISLPARAWAG